MRAQAKIIKYNKGTTVIESNAMPKEDSSDSFKFTQKVEFDISLQV